LRRRLGRGSREGRRRVGDVGLSNGVPAALTPVFADRPTRATAGFGAHGICRGSAMLFTVLGYGLAGAGRARSYAGAFLKAVTVIWRL
jgi:hypothetical protein